MKKRNLTIAILGAGNIGSSLARGLVAAGQYTPSRITLTRRNPRLLKELAAEGFHVTGDNRSAVKKSDLVVLAVLPQQLNELLDGIRSGIDPRRHLLVSVVSGVGTRDIQERLGSAGIQVVRAMPNTAIALRESMTCIASGSASAENMRLVTSLFNSVGSTVEIAEDLVTAATALCACGIAFFLRAIRAASQGGIEIGFHADEALMMAAQTAKGAASLLRGTSSHPEREIDKVTSPKGCTIAGLNEMEHQGFSSALIRGIRVSAEKAGELYVERAEP